MMTTACLGNKKHWLKLGEKIIVMVNKSCSTSGRTFFGQMRQSWRFLTSHISSVSTDEVYEAIKEKNTCCETCCGAGGPVCLKSMQGTLTSQGCREILERNLLPSVRKLCLCCRSWVQQQDNDPKHADKNIKQDWLTFKHWSILKCLSTNLDLNPIKHLLKQLKDAVWRKHPSSPEQLEQFAQEQWYERLPLKLVIYCLKLVI